MAEKFSLIVYIAGYTPAASRALQNLRDICTEILKEDDYDIAVVDILADPLEAERAKILATPTVVRTAPLPKCHVIGDLSDRDQVVNALGLAWD